MHTTRFGHRAFKDPFRQRCLAQRLAGIYVFLHHPGNFQPASVLPQLEWTLLHAVAPAHGLIQIAGAVGNMFEVHGGVMKTVAQNGPEELAFLAFGIAQQFQALGRGLFEHAAIHLVGLAACGDVVLAVQFELQGVAAHALVKALLSLVAQITQIQQFLQHLRCAEVHKEGVALLVQVLLHGLDDMGHSVKAHHICSAKGTA